MKKKYSLTFLIFLCLIGMGFGQVYFHNFGTTAISGSPYSVAPATLDANLSNSSWSTSSTSFTSYAGNSGQALSLDNSSGSPTYTLTFDVNTGCSLDITSFNFWRQRSNAGAQNWSMIINGTIVGSGTVPTTGAFVGSTSITSMTGLTGTVTIVITLSGASGSGTFRLDDFQLNGSTSCGPSTTTVDFDSTTYSVAEDGTSIDVCVNIANPSSSNATSTDIVLTSGSTPHLTYSTATVTFPANSSAQQCVTIPIANNSNCGDLTDYTFQLQSVSGGDSAATGTLDTTTLTVTDDDGASGIAYIQDFDGGTPNWNYTVFNEADEAVFGVVSSLPNINYTNISGSFFGINDANDEDRIVFDVVSTAGMTNIVFSFDYDVFEFDSGDNMFYEVFLDGVSQGKTQFITGAGNLSTEGTISYNIPDGTNSVYAILYVNQNGGGDYAAWDNVQIVADQCLPNEPFLIISGITNHGSVCPSSSATSITYTITNNGLTDANGINVVSSDTQFVISSLSSTTIPSNGGTATFNVIFTPNSAGLKTATLTATSSTSGSNTATYDIEGTGLASTVPAIVTNTANNFSTTGATLRATSSTFGICPSTIEKGFVYSINSINNNPINGGTGVTTSPNTPLGSQGAFTQDVTGLAEGTIYAYQAYLFDGTTYTYGGVQTFYTNITAPNNVTNTRACLEDTSGTISWTAPATGATPTGYMVFGVPAATYGTGTLTTANADYSYANSDFSVGTNNAIPASLGKLLYVGSATSVNISGLTEDSVYSFRVIAYRQGGDIRNFANGTTVGSRSENNPAQDDVATFNATISSNQVTLNWTYSNPLACLDEVVIFANESPFPVFTPSGDGSAYIADDTWNSAGLQTVYKGTGTSKAVYNLTNETEYCFKIYVRRGNQWSDGIEVCATPDVTYCDSYGTTTFDTGVTNVTFNTINNSSNIDNNAYSDFFPTISTTVFIGEQYNLSVNVNTDGNFTVYSKVWIDWDRDGSFNTGNEEYDLGTAQNTLDGATSESPLNILVPSSATLGTVRMRVSARYNQYATPCATGFDGEVEDYKVIIDRSPNAKMLVKGNSINIPNGFSSPYGLNNTLWGLTDVNTDGDTKTFVVENVGLSALNLTGAPLVEIVGANPGDFIVTTQPSASVASVASTTFDILFHPLADGTRTATVRILNNDDSPFEFAIEGTGNCTTSLTSSILPASGPEGTEITITSATDLTGAIATINGLPMPVVSSTSTELVVSVPDGATSGNISVLFNIGCSSTNGFTVIENTVSGCDTGSSSTLPTDLFISEVSDANTGSSSLIEIFNGTGATVDLSEYVIKIYNNGNSSPFSTSALSGTLANNATHVIAIGSTSCNLSTSGLNPMLPHQSFSSISGINFDINSSDAVILEKISGSNQGEKDSFGVKFSDNWANGLGIGGDGVNFRRHNNAPFLPTMDFELSHWDMIDWTNCSDSDYSHFGQFDFSTGVPPLVTLQPIAPVSSCDVSAILSVEGEEGVPNGNSLTYQWYYNVPGTPNWSIVDGIIHSGVYTGFNTENLTISNTLSLNNYQYYCQVQEDDATCYQASNAVRLNIEVVTWDGTNWTPTPPDSDKVAVINGNYNTSVGTNDQTSFEACNLIINNATLTIADSNNGGINTYVEVVNNVQLNGTAGILVHPQGAFVQINDAGTVTADNPDNIQVNKQTSPASVWYEYTYWSSPVSGALINEALAEANPNRRFKFSAQDYRDSYQETNNNNTWGVVGQDDIDDSFDGYNDGTGADWQLLAGSDLMVPGIGYAATHNPSTFVLPPGPCAPCVTQVLYTFNGLFNNGQIAVDIFRNDDEVNDVNWNFVGNPYPSAISANAFLNYNAVENPSAPNGVIEGAIYLWSQQSAPLDTNNGNEQLNFDKTDYAIINGWGETATSPGGDNTDPTNRMIPSGQGFFIAMAEQVDVTGSPYNASVDSTKVKFNNSMRVRGTLDNSQFFRQSHTSLNNPVAINKIKLNLTSDNGVFSQILVGYLDGATNGYDGMYYDALRNQSTGSVSMLYSTLNGMDKKLAIQGKAVSSLDLDEVIPLGFTTTISQATLYTISIAQLEGDFLTSNTVYLKDSLLNVYHDLSASDYSFTSEVGEFNNRFEIVFQAQQLSVDDLTTSENALTIIEQTDGSVKFLVNSNQIIEHIEILDLLGRSLYQIEANNYEVVAILPQLQQTAYIAKVALSSGQVLTKRAIKQH